MESAEEFVSDFLAHYASKYYDPAKAHEYYLRTRELAGRKVGDLKTQSKKEGWAYAKKNIEDAKKAELKSEAEKQTVKTGMISAHAAIRRKEIGDKLTALLAKVTDNRKRVSEEVAQHHKEEAARLAKHQKEEQAKIQERAKAKEDKLAEQHHKELQRISDEASRKISSMPPVPSGVSKEERAKLAADRSGKIAQIRGDADSQRKSLSDSVRSQHEAIAKEADDARASLSADTAGQRDAMSKGVQSKRGDISKWTDAEKAGDRASADKDREAVKTELKSSLDKARSDYQTLKDNLKAKYENVLNTEFEAIKNKV